MATSSITKNFVIEGKEQIKKFLNAIEESAKDRPGRIPVAAGELKGEELREFMKMIEEKQKRGNVRQPTVYADFIYILSIYLHIIKKCVIFIIKKGVCTDRRPMGTTDRRLA